MQSNCTGKHSEYDCVIKYSVSGLKFNKDKWCDNCKAKYLNKQHPSRWKK